MDSLSLPPRDALVVGAARLLAARGYAGASVVELAAASGATKNMLFHYFPGKQALALAALHLSLAALRREVLDPAARLAPEQRLDYLRRTLAELTGARSTAASDATPVTQPVGLSVLPEDRELAQMCLPLLAGLSLHRDPAATRLTADADAALAELHEVLRGAAKAARSGPRGDGPRARDVATQVLAEALGRCSLGAAYDG